MKKKLLSGDEAIARGAWEFGVEVAAAYPGTPSTEILENIAHYKDIKAQWSPNEKVAFEVGTGASIAGARTLVAMKHVGVNVAADPLMTFAYTGVNGGFVLVSADDPGMHSSQNEQDNRNYAAFAKIPMLEPSDAQEAKDFVGHALEISERFDTPVLLRITTRIAHAKGLVTLGERVIREWDKQQEVNREKYTMLPSFARKRRVEIARREKALAKFTEETTLNQIEMNNKSIGIITSGISYNYVKDVIPEASILKLGFTNPLPVRKIKEFASKVERLLVIEELDPYLEIRIKALGLDVEGKSIIPEIGELTPRIVREALRKAGIIEDRGNIRTMSQQELPPRPPAMCPGCPHLGVALALKKIKNATITGDIGCYTLSALPPLEIMQTCICMGASIGAAIGLEKARGSGKKIVGVIGDSTFLHSGITGLLDAVYNKSTVTIIISDNSITAMTGGQQHPATGYTLQGESTHRVDLVELCKTLGVKYVYRLDPTNHREFLKKLKEEVESDHLSVIITNQPCVLYPQKVRRPKYHIVSDLCIGCGACRKTSCPALSVSSEKTEKGHFKSFLDTELCTGCSLCASICPVGAIQLVEKGE